MRSFRWTVWVLVGLLVSSPFMMPAFSATDPSASGVTSADRTDLKDILRTGLKATRNDQLFFINRVVMLVDKGRLKESLVLSAYTYAIRKRRSYPFPYFKQAMIEIAKEKGIDL